MKIPRIHFASLAAPALLVMGGCGLLEPSAHKEYALVSVNGKPLPAVLDSGPIVHYTTPPAFEIQLFVLKRVSGTLHIANNDFKLDTRSERTFDGVARADMPPVNDSDDGYFHGPDTLAVFEAQHSQFAGRFKGDTALTLRDITGWYNYVTLEFRRTK